MAKSPEGSSFWSELFSFRYYKRNQGRLTRQLSAAGVALLLFFGCYTLSQGWLSDYVRTDITVRAIYPASEPDAQLDATLDQLAADQGGQRSDDELNRRTGRSLTYAFPASRFWSTSPERQKEALDAIAAFRESVEKKYPDRVQVSSGTATHRTPARWISFGIPTLLFFIGVWITWRAINFPPAADFLVSVEAEMDKVSWPDRQELFRATVVVLVTMIFLGAVLFSYDLFWIWLFQSIGILQDVS